MSCVNVLKLLMVERGVHDPAEKDRVRAHIREHASTCDDCAAIYEGLSAPVDETAVAEWRALFADTRSAAMPEPRSVETDTVPTSPPGLVSVLIDETEFHFPRQQSSGAELMALAAIPPDTGLIRVQNDGSQELIGAEEVVELHSGDRFRRAPRFARG